MERTDQADEGYAIPDLLTRHMGSSKSPNIPQTNQHASNQYPKQTYPPTPRSRSGSPKLPKVPLDHGTLPLQTPPQSTHLQPYGKILPGTSPRIVMHRTRSAPGTTPVTTGNQIQHTEIVHSDETASSRSNALSLIMGPAAFSHDTPLQRSPAGPVASPHPTQPGMMNPLIAASIARQSTPQIAHPKSPLVEPMDITSDEEQLIEVARQYTTGDGSQDPQSKVERSTPASQARSSHGLLASHLPTESTFQNTATAEDVFRTSSRSAGSSRNLAGADNQVDDRSSSRQGYLHQTPQNGGTPRQHLQAFPQPTVPLHNVGHSAPMQAALNSSSQAIWTDQQQNQHQYLSHQQQSHIMHQRQQQYQSQAGPYSLTPAQQQFVLMQQGVIPAGQAINSQQNAWGGVPGNVPIMLRGQPVLVSNPQSGPSTNPQQYQNVISPAQILAQMPARGSSSQSQNNSVYMTPLSDIYARSIDPSETQRPAHPPVQPLRGMPVAIPQTMMPGGYPAEEPRTADSSRTERSEAHQTEETASSEGNIARLCGSAWKDCGGDIVKEYALLKHYQLGLRDLMRQSSEVFYEGLSQWLLSLPPQTRLKDVFQAHLTVHDPQTGEVTDSPYLSTPLTVILEQYRDLDKKIVEYHMRNEKALDEFEHELRMKLEAGLRGLIDVEAMGLVGRARDDQGERTSSQVSIGGSAASMSNTLRREALTPVEISGNAKILRRIQEIDDMNVFVDSNGEVHVYKSDQQIPTPQRPVSKPTAQSTAVPPLYQPHTTSFPQGPINRINASNGAEKLSTWLMPSKTAEQGQNNTASSSNVQTQHTRAMSRHPAQNKASGSRSNAPMEEDDDGESEIQQTGFAKRKPGRTPASEKSNKKPKAVKRRAEEMESEAEYEKPKKYKPSPKNKKKA